MRLLKGQVSTEDHTIVFESYELDGSSTQVFLEHAVNNKEYISSALF